MSACLVPLPSNGAALGASAFDDLPLAAFVVDDEFNIIDFNLAGAKLLERVPHAVLRFEESGAPQCLHALNADREGACEECRVKNFVRNVFAGVHTCRKIGRLRLMTDGKPSYADFLVTATPFTDSLTPRSLLVLDEASELAQLLCRG